MPRLSARAAAGALLAGAAVAGGPLALAGCGEPATFQTSRPILRLKVDEYRIVPQNVVVAPGRLKLVVTNTGRLTHNLVIQVPPKKLRAKPVEIGRTDTMQPGASAPPIKVDLQPGRKYRLICTIGNHDDLGQYGSLTVRK